MAFFSSVVGTALSRVALIRLICALALTIDNRTTNINNICYGEYSNPSCGYNNDLLDNGGSYLFNEMSSNSIVLWKDRHVDSANNFKVSYGLRPVIKLSKTVKVISGTGTMDDPFVINN